VRLTDVVIVGGGPAGASCARALLQGGLEVIVLDKAAFPRTKLCAGWVTPEALADVGIEPGEYPLGINVFERLHLHWKWLSAAPRSLQYSIRRFEFDDFLLKRSGAEVQQRDVRSIRTAEGGFIVDGEFRCRFLVGAGGTACPVYRTLFRKDMPRNVALQTATLEKEFPYEWHDAGCHLWFFEDGLPGYAWYVPKARGYLNVGLGAMAARMKGRGMRLRDCWDRFTGKLLRLGLADIRDIEPRGYSYYLRGASVSPRRGNAFLIGDAAGLATRDLCEGIGPAVHSARLAADAILHGADYRIDAVSGLSGNGIGSRWLEARFAGGRNRHRDSHAANADTGCG
jgi:flavin-dependent dehydrogenase